MLAAGAQARDVALAVISANGVMQTETPVPPPESDSASAIDTETTNDFSGLILMITAILALGFLASWGWAFSSSR